MGGPRWEGPDGGEREGGTAKGEQTPGYLRKSGGERRPAGDNKLDRPGFAFSRPHFRLAHLQGSELRQHCVFGANQNHTQFGHV